MNDKPVILIVEDEKNTREGLEKALNHNYQAILADNGARALQILAEKPVDILLTDLRMPGMDGLTLVRRAIAHDCQPVCIVLTAFGSIESAVEAMKAGAYDFLTKPLNLDQLEIVIQRALRSRRLEDENRSLRTQLDRRFGLEAIIGLTPPMEELFELIRQVAPARATALIQGESGTGKELVAHAIHNLSPRARGPFIAVHCAALSQNLLESELFGHEKGSFTGAVERRRGRFELAEGGTLFLDEISEIEPALQVKLLRVLEERKFERVGGQETLEADIRLVTATNNDLAKLVQEGKFRKDLFYRINVLTITLPPLRERRDDIPLLVRHFIDDFARENNRKIEDISSDAMSALVSCDWPGNVRELKNVIERMVVLSHGTKLTLRDLPSSLRVNEKASPQAGGTTSASSIKEANRRMIISELEANGGNRTLTAKQLGISRRTLHRKLREFGIKEK
ncbi:MAG: sigma-54 dependent transcriptional regulator [Kiritimatiellia bacterium]|nr:sigma-54 dependent transcriptional regulator [Kiritimatiellia bacterium]